MDQVETGPNSGFPLAGKVRVLPPDRVWTWLRLGWDDLLRAGPVSLAYGALFVIIGFAITGGLVWIGMPYLITPMIGSFLLIGPLLALGLYDISRRIEQGGRPGFVRAMLAWRANSFHILTAGLILMLTVMIWARLSVVLFALFFPYQTMSLESFLVQAATLNGVIFTAMMVALGFVFAAAAFVTNVVTLPMMLDRKVDVFSAALVSVVAVVRNPRLAALWAALIVAVTGLALATAFLGLVVALPLIGHASWHAYRDLVERADQQAAENPTFDTGGAMTKIR